MQILGLSFHIISYFHNGEQSLLWQDGANAQACLSLHRSHNWQKPKAHVLAKLFSKNKITCGYRNNQDKLQKHKFIYIKIYIYVKL